MTGENQSESGTSITQEEYEMHLRYLAERLETYLNSGEGKRDQLLKEATELLEMGQEHYPGILGRHPEITGMVGDILARQEQQKFMANAHEQKNGRPGCLLGWLLGGGKETR